MVKINSSEANIILNDNPGTPVIKTETDPKPKNTSLQGQDKVNVKKPENNSADQVFKSSGDIKLKNNDTLGKKDPEPEKVNPWKVKSLHVAYGLQDVRFSNSDI